MPAMSAVAVIAFGTISVLQELTSLFHVLSFTNVLHDIYRGYRPVELIKSYVDTDIFVCKN